MDSYPPYASEGELYDDDLHHRIDNSSNSAPYSSEHSDDDSRRPDNNGRPPPNYEPYYSNTPLPSDAGDSTSTRSESPAFYTAAEHLKNAAECGMKTDCDCYWAYNGPYLAECAYDMHEYLEKYSRELDDNKLMIRENDALIEEKDKKIEEVSKMRDDYARCVEIQQKEINEMKAKISIYEETYERFHNSIEDVIGTKLCEKTISKKPAKTKPIRKRIIKLAVIYPKPPTKRFKKSI